MVSVPCPRCRAVLSEPHERCPFCGQEFGVLDPTDSPLLGNVLLALGQVIALIACAATVVVGVNLKQFGPLGVVLIVLGVVYHLAIFVALGRAKRR